VVLRLDDLRWEGRRCGKGPLGLIELRVDLSMIDGVAVVMVLLESSTVGG